MVPRLALYGATSTALAAAVVGSAIHTRANFFAAAVTIGRSSGSLMVLANFALFNVICFGMVVKKIFFGQLRSIEYEHLFERLWMFLTESLLALTIFSREKNNFSIGFLMMYSMLLFLKCFHWITADRVDYMDQIPSPGPPRTFHIRISSIILILLTLDIAMVTYTIQTISYYGISSMVLFASEYMILLSSILGTSARYIIGLIDLRRARGREDAPSWEEKSMYLFYVDLAVDFAKLLTYLCFFTVILINYGLPLHILRDVYMTLKSFISRCSDLIRYRRATRDMDALYPNATSEELEASGDHTCIICREEMAVQVEGDQPRSEGPNETPKKLACGHIFHFHCLRSWLERQQSCPTCRRDVLRNPSPTARPTAAPGAPAAPGQVPQPNQAVPPANLPGQIREPLPTPLQAMYNEFFRPNRENRLNPTPSPTAPPPPAATQPATNQERIQTGIWGGPITPGRFFPTPLGAGPSQSNRTVPYRAPAPGAAPTPSAPPPAPAPTASITTNSSSAAAAAVAASPEHSPTTSSFSTHTHRTFGGLSQYVDTATRRQGSIKSGSTTPFSSNPPEIFSSPGTSRQSIGADARAALNGGDTSSNNHEDHEGEVEDNDETVAEPLISADQRRVAAEAAMRRLGIGKMPVETVTSPISETTLPVNGSTVDLKGKGKAVEIEETARGETLLDTPRYIPYLSSSLPPPHPQTAHRSWTSRSRNLGQLQEELRDRLNETGVAQSLDDRIRVLRDVDEVIWGLMGELTQVRSRWEAEDVARRHEDTSTQHSQFEH